MTARVQLKKLLAVSLKGLGRQDELIGSKTPIIE
jgi:hypothetical protein